MTKEEQIKKEAKEYADDNPDKVQRLIAQVGFISGAEWADQNPSTETINRIIELYKHWYSEQCDIAVTEYVKQNFLKQH